MGITIHYRGTLDDVSQIEDMEDRVVDLVFALGGQATIWRSYAEHDHSRVVRGLMIDMTPGTETFSLLVSPEGHLTPLFQIEEAERSPFNEPPQCFVKTQFGSTQGHIAIVHLLDALRQRYCSNLVVMDEGEYHESRDVAKLTEKMQFLAQAMDSLVEGLREFGLSGEAAEDTDIVASRIERIAKLVQQKMLAERSSTDDERLDSRDAVNSDDELGSNDSEPDWQEASLEDEVETMDRHRRQNQLRSERMSRRIAEATASGMSVEEAFSLAMREEGLEAPTAITAESEFAGGDENDEAWRESLPPDPLLDADDPFCRENHPAVELAQQFMRSLMDLQNADGLAGDFLSSACRGAGDVVGGLVQATSDRLETRTGRALAITQLKRALSGHAFARGAVFALRGSGAMDDATSHRLHDNLAPILDWILQLLSEAWDETNTG